MIEGIECFHAQFQRLCLGNTHILLQRKIEILDSGTLNTALRVVELPEAFLPGKGPY